ncbi:MAG: protein-glutamate O-methyltransferase CheR [Candidatus Omnitrophica bacterium]|nr:protein-glutamate O-methyltransferase CheR [Candidatus Omnitrophota bacterium]
MPSPELSENDVERVVRFIKKKRGIDLSPYRGNFILRRLRLCMSNAGCSSVSAYAGELQNNQEEFDRFLDSLSINVTEFFRDKGVFTLFAEHFLPEVAARKKTIGSRSLKIWSAGCATGEEPYSLAIILNQTLSHLSEFFFRIVATDVDEGALAIARKGEYPASLFQKVDKKILDKYFVSVYNDTYKINEQIRKTVFFKKLNFFSDPPVRNVDVIFCRNVMIYMTTEQKNLLVEKFHDTLNPGGYLVVGKVEALFQESLFMSVSSEQKIYRKRD